MSGAIKTNLSVTSAVESSWPFPTPAQGVALGAEIAAPGTPMTTRDVSTCKVIARETVVGLGSHFRQGWAKFHIACIFTASFSH